MPVTKPLSSAARSKNRNPAIHGKLAEVEPMRIIEDDDAGYLAWVESHQHGFVVNTIRKPDPPNLILHRASCGAIRGKPTRGNRWTTGEFIKVCSGTRAALDQ
jgi:hypothetical protein